MLYTNQKDVNLQKRCFIMMSYLPSIRWVTFYLLYFLSPYYSLMLGNEKWVAAWESLEGLYVYYISNDERYHEKCPAHGLFYKHPFGIDKGNERYKKKLSGIWLGVLKSLTCWGKTTSTEGQKKIKTSTGVSKNYKQMTNNKMLDIITDRLFRLLVTRAKRKLVYYFIRWFS